MKNIFIILGGLVAMQSIPVYDAAAQSSSPAVSFNVFYNELSPQGDWVSCGNGVYGWRPIHVSAGWRPYTVGRWAWTDDGWYWVSDEPWGWATYHYGRWYYDDYYGWTWIPGYDWAPAWVDWRYGEDCVGWAPLSPYAVFSVSWGIHYRTRWQTPATWWNFVRAGYIASPEVHRYVYRTETNTRYIGVTRSGGSVRYTGGRIVTRGPDREFVERQGNVRIETAGIRDVGGRGAERIVRDGGKERIDVYRPRIEVSQDENNLGRPDRVREDGRTVQLDTRKTDVRAREVQREESKDMRPAEEFHQRDAIDGERGVTRRPSDNSGTVERSRERNQGDRQMERRSEGRVERQQPPVQPERQRQRNENVRERQPESKIDAPARRNEGTGGERRESRNGGGERNSGGRDGRGR